MCEVMLHEAKMAISCFFCERSSTQSMKRAEVARLVRAPAHFVSSRRRHTCTQAGRKAISDTRPASRLSRRTAARYPYGRSWPVGAPRNRSSQRPDRSDHQRHCTPSPWTGCGCLGPLGFLENVKCSFAVTSAAGRGAAPQHTHKLSRKEHSSIFRYIVPA